MTRQTEASEVDRADFFAAEVLRWLEKTLQKNVPEAAGAALDAVYRGCPMWAINDPDVLNSFSRETGTAFVRARSPVVRAIDIAMGYDAEIARRFIAWFNEYVWGKAAVSARKVAGSA